MPGPSWRRLYGLELPDDALEALYRGSALTGLELEVAAVERFVSNASGQHARLPKQRARIRGTGFRVEARL
jgi:hypothetical protein